MSFSITNSFLEEFDYMFYPYLQQNGSQLMQAVTQEEVHGAVKYMRQQLVGDAHFRTGHGDTTEYTSILNDRRMLKPRAFACPIMLDDIDMVMQGTPDPGQLAQQAANSCGKLLDKIIIQGIGGANYTEASGEVNLSKPANATIADKGKVIEAYDKTNTIAWNDYTLGGNISDTTMSVICGLNTSKIAKAVQKLQSKFNYPPIVCVASSYALSTLRADPRMASTDFNNLHALADAQNPTYAGVNAFVASELVDGGVSNVKPADGKMDNGSTVTQVEYAYVYCMNNVKLGCSMPLSLKNGTNAERYLNDVIIYQGMYDCTRMFEDSVVRIEILKNVASVAPEAIVH